MIKAILIYNNSIIEQVFVILSNRQNYYFTKQTESVSERIILTFIS